MEPWEEELLESARRETARQKREADTPIYFEAYAAMREKMWAGIFARVEDRDSKREAAIARAQKENKELENEEEEEGEAERLEALYWKAEQLKEEHYREDRKD